MPKTAASTDLTPIELAALARAAKAAEKTRDQLEDGATADVDVTVRLHGTLQVGLPAVMERRVKPDLVLVVALVLEALGAGERRKLEKKLDGWFDVYRRVDSIEWPESAPEMRILAEQAVARWSQKEERGQRGAVTGVIVAEVVARD